LFRAFVDFSRDQNPPTPDNDRSRFTIQGKVSTALGVVPPVELMFSRKRLIHCAAENLANVARERALPEVTGSS
jgi:hypothetical protein